MHCDFVNTETFEHSQVVGVSCCCLGGATHESDIMDEDTLKFHIINLEEVCQFLRVSYTITYFT